jgi:hypothetical protein
LNSIYRLLEMGFFAVRHLAFVDFPVAFGVESHLEQTVLGIVVLAAAWADEIAAPGGSLAIVVFGN